MHRSSSLSARKAWLCATLALLAIGGPLGTSLFFTLPCTTLSAVDDGPAFSTPATAWDFTVGAPSQVLARAPVPIFNVFPDGHITILRDAADKNWVMFWAGASSYRTTGFCPTPDGQFFLDPSSPVMGGASNADRFDNGGSWLMNAFRIDGEHLLGFVHAEDHWYPHEGNDVAWKSIAVTQSFDDGRTWLPAEQIITCWVPKPVDPAWGGAGDFCVVRDEQASRWLCIYQEYTTGGLACLHAAESTDPLGAPGTWLKWNGTNFTVPGLGGFGKPLPRVIDHPGANPSLHWNVYLATWVMVYGGWDGKVYITSSQATNLTDWVAPRVLVESDQAGRAWYPTIVGARGDAVAGKDSLLYYSDMALDFSVRKFYRAPLHLER
jgi:hypothetical protein